MNVNKIFRKAFILKNIIRFILLKKRESFPRLLSIELTNACNANCIMCPRSKLTRKTAQMDFELFKKIIDNCQDRNVGEIKELSSAGRFTFPCDHPFNELVIAADGTAGMCCLDTNLTQKTGDANTNTSKEIWNGSELKKIRKLMIENKYDLLPICQTCNSFIFQENSVWANIWQ